MSETELLTETENFCLNWVVFLTEELSIVVSQLRPLELFEFEFSRKVDVASLYAFHNFETKKIVNLQLIFCNKIQSLLANFSDNHQN